jgi:hypothetical protein
MIVNIREGMRFGVGIDTLTQGVRAVSIEYDGETVGVGGQSSYPTIKLVETQQDLHHLGGQHGQIRQGFLGRFSPRVAI